MPIIPKYIWYWFMKSSVTSPIILLSLRLMSLAAIIALSSYLSSKIVAAWMLFLTIFKALWLSKAWVIVSVVVPILINKAAVLRSVFTNSPARLSFAAKFNILRDWYVVFSVLEELSTLPWWRIIIPELASKLRSLRIVWGVTPKLFTRSSVIIKPFSCSRSASAVWCWFSPVKAAAII